LGFGQAGWLIDGLLIKKLDSNRSQAPHISVSLGPRFEHGRSMSQQEVTGDAMDSSGGSSRLSFGQEQGRLYQKVAEQLADVIASGEFPVGSRLPAERKLAERFEVSRPTIREAIIALELAGCVEVKGGSGVYVTSGSAGGLSSATSDIGPFEILEARLIFEGEAAAVAAKVISDDELVKLKLALESMVQENEQEHVSEYADEAFHLIIAKATHNEAIISVCQHLWSLRNDSSISARILEKVRQAGSRPRIDEHAVIYAAIAERSPDKARNAMREHLNRVAVQLLETTEAEAVEEARRRISRERERFSPATDH